MVTAARDDRRHGAPPAPWRDDETHPGMTGQRPHATYQLSRTEHAVAIDEARREIDDLDALPGVVPQLGAHHGGIRQVVLLGTRQTVELDAHLTLIGQPVGAVEQRIEQRRTVEARHATPDDAAAAIDQRADRAVADQGEVQTGRRARHSTRMGAHVELRGAGIRICLNIY